MGRSFHPHIITDDSSAGGKVINGSLVFNIGRENFLRRTPSSDGNRRTFTFSCWFKRTRIGGDQRIFSSYNGSSIHNQCGIKFFSNNTFQVFNSPSGSLSTNLITNRFFRDTSAWMHIVVAVDTTQGTAANRVLIYINGEQETSFSTANYGSQNEDWWFDNNSAQHIGGRGSEQTQYSDMHLTEVHHIDGQVLDPSYFGYTDSSTGIWRPKKYTYGNYGTCGYYLPLDGSGVPTDDQSGRNNHWTPFRLRPTVSLENATGALPIMRTNKSGSHNLAGTREDAYKNNIVVALPFNTGFRDYSWHIKGSGSINTVSTGGSPTVECEGSGQQGGPALYSNSLKLVRASSQYAESVFSSVSIGTGDFTVEGWFQNTTNSSDMNLVNLYDSSTRKWFVQARVNNSADDLHIRYYGSGGQYNSDALGWSGDTASLKVWYHFAHSRSSGVSRTFLNGVKIGQHNNTEDIGNVDRLRVGYMAGDGTKYVDGFAQDVRFYNGVGKYTSNFSVPSASPTITSNSPSGVAVARKPSVLENGSVTIDGESDYLKIPYSSDFDLGSSWTIEFWLYPYTDGNGKLIGTRGDGSPRGWEIVYWNGGQVGVEQYGDQSTSGQVRGSIIVEPLTWHHIAVTHNGTNTKTYIDGVLDLNTTTSNGSNWGAGSHELRIGRPEAHAEAGRYAISNLRIVKGSVVYSANFKPPTEPLTNITNTKLLCCNSKTSPLNATVSQTRTGPTITANGGITHSTDDPYSSSEGSTSNSGTGYLEIPSDSFIVGYGDFTIEGWLKSTQAGGTNQEGVWSIISGSSAFQTGNGNLFRLVQGRDGDGGQDGALEVTINGIAVGTTDQDVLAENTWTHVAVSRKSGRVRIFVGGVEKASGIADGSFTGNRFVTGYYNNNYTFQGNMADVRFVNGRAIYTGNFTPPTSPLPNIPNSVLRCCSSDSSAASSGQVYTTPVRYGDTYANDFNPFDEYDSTGQESGYCILNTVDKNTNVTPSDGGLHFACSASGDGKVRGTISFTEGKYYFEDTVAIAARHHVGVMDTETSQDISGDLGNQPGEWVVRTDNYGVHNANSRGENVDPLSTDTTNKIGYVWMVAVDADNGKIYFGKNGAWLNGADPARGQNPVYSNLSGRLSPAMGRRTGANAANINFGQRPFVYNPPEGFLPLCTSNLKHSPVRNPAQHCGVLLWTGNGSVSGQNITDTGLEFKPDLVWIKQRNGTQNNLIHDTVRGIDKYIKTDENAAESTNEDFVTQMLQGGFKVGNSGVTNGSGETNVAWCWKGGGTAVTNNDGNIASQVSANKEAGFSICSWTINTSGVYTIGHGLGKAPAMIIMKNRDTTNNWDVYHESVGPNYRIKLNSDTNREDYTGPWNDTAPDSSKFTSTGSWLGGNGNKIVAYCWAEITGYSRFGIFKGNSASSDNTYIHCGFRPAFIMSRDSTEGGTGWWWRVDTKRDPDNVVYNMVDANRANPERTDTIFDICSNGFKVRLGLGTSDFIFMAFAEQPQGNPFGGQSDAR